MIDWQKITNNLRNYKPLSQVAKEVDMDAGTLRRIARGDTPEPKFSAGIKLLDLHLDNMPEIHNENILL